MKHLSFQNYLSSWLALRQKHRVDISTTPFELIVHLCYAGKGSFLITVDDKLFSNVYQSYGGLIEGLGFLPPVNFFNETSVAGFRSSEREGREFILSQLTMGGFPKTIITTPETLNVKSFKINKDSGFNLKNTTGFDVLVDWLRISSYSFEEIVTKQGECSLKGGVIDVFPYNKSYPVRISFLSETLDIYRFDIESQITTGSVKINRLSPKASGDTHSVKDAIPKNTTFIELFEGPVGSESPLVEFNFSIITHDVFVKQKSSFGVKVEPSSSLIKNGYLFKDLLIVPGWFLGKEVSGKTQGVPKALGFNSLSIGDRVVHKHHGVGSFGGVYNFGKEGVADERLLLEYFDGGKIYVSIQNLGLLEYYGSSRSGKEGLDNLSKKGLWNSKKRAAKKKINEIVEELLKGYADRSTASKAPLLVDKEVESLFISSFPFEETKDQSISWGEVSKDLESEKPMDRLLCGDVGFGKTEIALRATFRMAFAGKQVAVLAPTTILSSQHFHTFQDRLGPFSIDVGLISAFKTKGENNKTLKELMLGKINVIIGTHSLLSDSVKFKNLGLLIVDEEHRFGVKQKEKILNIKNNVDVLSMSATPIPRTLHMSLSGIKSISTINTPPKSRFPIKTQIQYYGIKQVRSIIFNEINRGGQVFFVHNSVKSLNEMVETLRNRLPGLNIELAHGREPKKLLEKTMTRFIEGSIDVLVCTSIIETGIDISNVNTIIINRAHRFGLSQLYQIRGRVGRGDKQAFAYLLIPKGLQLSQNAYKRLKSIEKNTSLGSGYNISKSDMEIRGVGSIFGYKQSGGIGQIGYGLYSKMIKETLQEKNIIEKKFIIEPEDTSVNLFIDMAITNEYISSESIRLEFYRKLAKCEEIDRYSKIEYELENRFGPIPSSLANLILNYKTKIFCANLGIKKCVIYKNTLQLEFLPTGVAGSVETLIPKMIEFAMEQNVEPRFLPGNNKALNMNININKKIDIYTFMGCLMNKLTAIFLA